MAVSITRKPSRKPANMRLRRGTGNGGCSIDAEWGVPADAVDDNRRDRWNYLDEYWTFRASKDMSDKWVQQRGDGHAVGDRVWARDKGRDHSSSTVWFNRSAYHPIRAGRRLLSVTVELVAGNWKGKQTQKAVYELKPPRKPSVPAPEVDGDSGAVTWTVSNGDHSDRYDRHDTRYRVLRRDSASANTSYSGKWREVRGWRTSTAEEFAVTVAEPAIARRLMPGQWSCYRIEAYNRGCAGDSAHVARDLYYHQPPRPAIGSITCDTRASTGVVRVAVSRNDRDRSGKLLPQLAIESMQLQRLADVAHATAAAAAASSGWEDVDGAYDEGQANGLTDSVAHALPGNRKHTWYRVRVTACGYSRYSPPKEATCLYHERDATSDDAVRFASVDPSGDGRGIVAKLAWRTDDSTTTEVSWSDHEAAWESTEEPESFDLSWEDPSPQVPGYAHSATLAIRGLEEGTPYYIRARRKRIDGGDVQSVGPWCVPPQQHVPCAPAAMPTGLALSAPAVVARGEGVECTWTYSGPLQRAWQLHRIDGGSRTLVASGEGSDGAARVPAEMLDGVGSVTLVVSVTTGGDWAESPAAVVAVADPPALALSADASLSAQPVEVALSSDRPSCEVVLHVRAGTSSAGGVSTQMPDRDVVQALGDIVWSYAGTPAWAGTTSVDEDGDPVEAPPYTATVAAPAELALFDGGSYAVEAVATDPGTGLSSAPASAGFAVAWAHQAVPPNADSTVLVPDADAMRVAITPGAPDGAAEGDVCDVYRRTPDGCCLIAADVPFGSTVTDRHAPYSALPDPDLAYRLATRTTDGDVAWSDFGYGLYGESIRFDWDFKSVELPYDPSSDDGFEKGFEVSARWDGSRVGRWDAGRGRKATLSASVVKVEMAETRRLLAEMGGYAGPVFVRVPDGCAYTANVALDTFGFSFESAAVPVSATATEIGIVDAYRIGPDDREE